MARDEEPSFVIDPRGLNANLSILVGQNSRVSHARIRTQRARFDSPFKNSKHHLSVLRRKMKALPYFPTKSL